MSDSADKKHCVFCAQDATSNKLIKFTPEILKKCLVVMEFRRTKPARRKSRSNYSDVHLSSEKSLNDYYHAQCYKLYTAVRIPVVSTTTPIADISTDNSVSGLSQAPQSASTSTDDSISGSQATQVAGTSTDDSVSGFSQATQDADIQTDKDNIAEEADFEDSNDYIGLDDDSNKANLSPKICFICGKSRKRLKGREVPIAVNRKTTIETLKSAATEFYDVDMLEKISSYANDSEICYHKCCKDKYLRDLTAVEESDYIKSKKVRNLAYSSLCEMIEEYVIKNKECLFYEKVKSEYLRLLTEQAELVSNSIRISSFSEHHLDRKLMETFDKKIKIIYAEKKKFLAPFSANFVEHKELFESMTLKETIRTVALRLREEAIDCVRTPLPDDCTAEDLIQGECNYIPELLSCFLETFILGDVSHLSRKSRDKKKENYDLTKFSLGQDLVYAACNHKIKTSKHISLGLAVKSLCNSKKIVNLLSRYGHCCSYTILEELETALTFSTVNSDFVCPEDIKRRPDLNTGVAFDNYDRFIETLNGKDTLHDTVGIIFEDKVQDEHGIPPTGNDIQDFNPIQIDNYSDASLPSEESSTSNGKSTPTEESTLEESTYEESTLEEQSISSKKRKRKQKKRSFNEITYDMRPYTKKLKVATWNHLDILALNKAPINLQEVKQLDIAWMMSHTTKITDTPMWVGYHSKIIIDNSPVQIVSYLTPINDTPTNHSIVLKTLEQSQKVAQECQAPYIQVTYDLAIARISYCIQAQESPKFDNVFIHMGAFHIEMAFFKAVGTFIEECGLTNIMIDCDLIADGSVAGFIAGKNYNRCKRLHSLVSLSLQQLHFETYLENKNVTINDSVTEFLKEFMEHKDISPRIVHSETEKIITDYDQYTTDTLEGKHGKTAQFYAMYIDLINLYHIFIKSIRVGDLDLYCYALGKIVPLFFMYNQPNYSRWLVYYLNQLQHINDTHPGLRADVSRGSFGIRRTTKPFSRIPVDLTLEQTINGDAARRLTGITNLTSSISARQRWARNHGARTRIISHVLTRAVLNTNLEDVASDLKPDRMKKNRELMENFSQSIKQTANPFSYSFDQDQLYNISTGKASTPEIAASLLNALSSGEFLRDKFITECNTDSERFHKSLKKNPVLTFVNLKKKKSIKIGQTVHEVKLQRDLFGRLLGLSLETKLELDLDKVLCFPITPVPLSLCHIDGSINKTVKSVLLQKLEKTVEEVEQPPDQLDYFVVDGFFFLNTFKQVPRSFGDLSKKILHSLVNYPASHVAIIFDRYFTPSIKDYEHTLRGYTEDKDVYISGPQQKRTADFAKELKNIKFKEAFVKFLIEHWTDREMATIIGNKTIYLNHDLCYVYTATNNEVTRTVNYDLSCQDHEEADTKIVFFTCQLKEDSTVTIRTSDTDIVVIMLSNMEYLQAPLKIWIDLGVGNARRNVNISALFSKLGLPVSQALPALHALTGCDYNPAFYRKGKKKPFDIMMKSEVFQKAFADLGSETYNIEESLVTMESFICHLYGLKKLSSVNRARVEIFNKTYRVTDTTQPFSLNVRNYDACNLPPCQSELRQHLLRTKYIACLWRNAHFRLASDMSPTDFGWKNVEGKLEMNWFTGKQIPDLYEDIVISPDIFGDISDSAADSQNFDENDVSDLNFQVEEESSDEDQ